jgi:hypothetical protein
LQARLFEDGTVPVHTTAEWYASRERAPHLEEGLHRGRLLLCAEFVNTAIVEHAIQSVSDMGCGDGGLLSLINSAEAWGYDLQPSNVAGGKDRGVDVRLGSALADDVEWGELTVCTECLEHLVDPHAFLRRIPSRFLVASSPATETAEHHYPFHTWAWDEAGYGAMLSAAGFRVERHEREGMFQVVLAARL